MQEVSISEIVQQKVLKFDLFDEDGGKIFSMGEILTPGKIIVIKEYGVLFKKESDEEEIQSIYRINPDKDIENSINNHSVLTPQEQHKIIDYYVDINTLINNAEWEAVRLKSIHLRDVLIKTLRQIMTNIKYSHEIKIIGKQNIAHPLNTALYSTMLAIKLELSDMDVNNIALGALLHDIGKSQLSQVILDNPNATKKNHLMYQSHTVLGYKILKNDLMFPTNVARIALEHHETMDGSGWPYGISNTMLSEYAQLVAVCNVFDNYSTSFRQDSSLTFSNVLKELLKLGSKSFSPKALYTFVHMFNYSDAVTYWDLIQDD